MQKLRVLHLGRFHREHGFGGIERHVTELLTALAPDVAADNLVAADSLRGDHFHTGHYEVWRAPSFGMFASTAVSPAMISWARRLHSERKFDLVHLHFPDPLAQLVAQSLPRQIKRVVTWHSDIVRQGRLLKLYRPWMNHFLRHVDAVIAATPAHFLGSTQLCAVPEARRQVIPYGLDFTRLSTNCLLERSREFRSKIPADIPVIFAVGRHVYYKGFDDLLKALSLLPHAHLVLGGNGPLEGDLIRLALQLGLEKRVTFTGRLSDEDLATWYHACDVFCLPSREVAEAFGLVQLEAMACGKPVVCTQLDNGVNFVCQDGVTGLAAEPGNPLSLAKKLQQLLDNPDLRGRLGEAGRQRAETEFSRERMAERTLALYRTLVRS